MYVNKQRLNRAFFTEKLLEVFSASTISFSWYTIEDSLESTILS